MATIIAVQFVTGALILAVGARFGRWLLAVAAAPLLVSVLWLAARFTDVVHGRPGDIEDAADRANGTVQHIRWLYELGVSFSFRLDGFAWLMALIVSGVGVIVLWYSASYFGPGTPARDLARFGGFFVAFAGAMLGFVLADDLWTMFIFWEITSITSFLLIGLDDRSAEARSAALRALLVTGSGGLALLVGVALLAANAGTTSLLALRLDTPGGASTQVALVLVLIGAFTKSAQVPFHFWLPGAMAAPTPVSAYLHSATMVKAGVVLVGRLAPIFATVGWWRPLLVAVGGATMLTGGLRALRQDDAKLLLAHGTVSQLGLLMVLFGYGSPEATAAGVALLVAHALYKAALFLCVGIVDHATGARDIRRLTRVGHDLPWLAGVAALAAASMAGIPPLLGFVAKEAALDGLIESPGAWAAIGLVFVALGSVLTVAYTARLWWGLFTSAGLASPPRDDLAPATVHHRPSAWFVAPAAVLTAGSVMGGLVPRLLEPTLDAAGRALDPESHAHLALWSGLHAPLLISLAIILAGALLALYGGGLGRVRTTRWPSGERAYQALFDGLIAGSGRVTAVVQSGSLPAYVATVFSVVVAAVAAAFVTGATPGDRDTVLANSTLQAVVALLSVLLAVGVVAARRRFVSVLLLGSVGYGMAVLFVLYGAPDLAITQFLVETLSLVVFLLVLRQLPEGYATPPAWAPRSLRVTIAVGVGVAVSGFALVAGTSRTATPASEEMIARALPEGGGHNVVNVVVIDIRGVDTMGEITVLAVAAAGVANLAATARRARAGAPASSAARAGARANSAARAGAPASDTASDLSGGAGGAGGAVGPPPPPLGRAGRAGPRSLVFDQATRLMFHLILLVSVYVTVRGHNAPGGGFAGGLIASCAFVMRLLAGGEPRLARSRRLPPTSLIGTGLLFAIGTGVAALLAGGDFLESGIVTPDLPVIGPLKLVSSAVFDAGVYLVVLGVVLSLLSDLGTEGGRTTVADAAVQPSPSTKVNAEAGA